MTRPIVAVIKALEDVRILCVAVDAAGNKIPFQGDSRLSTISVDPVSWWGVVLEDRRGFFEVAGNATLVPLGEDKDPAKRLDRRDGLLFYGYAFPGETTEAAVERINRPWWEAVASVAARHKREGDG